MSDTVKRSLHQRFRGYFPVVIDIETGGFNPATDALLEIAAVTLKMDDDGFLTPDQKIHFNVSPFIGANLDPSSLAFTGIDPNDPERNAVAECEALKEIFKLVRKSQKAAECHRSIVVAHNAAFDNAFLNAAVARCNIKRNPFHPFATFDTATAAGIAYGQTVLQKACKAAQIDFDSSKAHSAEYDTIRTAELFCSIINRWQSLGGWPVVDVDEETGDAE
ncbi:MULTISPECIES: ribonuclease T [Corallincola]|uniref:Ribonuclease T n=2 Tax=Corallincola TaxID=1775176 RepID=A0A368NIY0_9GAMM|nr:MULTISPECIES: ribonuclease T [Corallincola]RCU50398.1 ribonuclease T [Corallincola holothuriorum]TAA48591.1 ribonuclease T [Corallincola spongiicola]